MTSYFVTFINNFILKDGLGSRRLRQVRKTSIAQIGNRVVILIVKFVSIPLALTIVGQEKYGVWLTLLSLVSWFSMSDIGLPSALMNPLAEAIGISNEKKIHELISTTTFTLLGIGMVICSLCFAFVWTLPIERILGLSNITFNIDVRSSALVVVILYLGLLALKITDVITLAMQKGYWSSLVDTIASIASLIGMLILKFLGGNLTTIAIVVTLPGVIGRIVLWWFLVKKFGDNFLPDIHNWSKQVIQEIGKDGLTFYAGTWGELLVLQTPNIIIAQLLGAVAVPLFAIPYQIFYSAYVFLNTLANPLWPAYAEAKSSGDLPWIQRTHWRVTKESLFLAIPGFIALGALCRWFVGIWVGHTYSPSMFLSFIFAIHFIQWTWNYVFVILLTGLGFIRERVKIVLIFGVLNVFLSILLAKHYAIIGIAIGMLLSMFLTQTWYLPMVIYKKARWVF